MEGALEAMDSQLTAGYEGMSTKLDVLGQKTAGQVHVLAFFCLEW